jgi:hypothetical protein
VGGIYKYDIEMVLNAISNFINIDSGIQKTIGGCTDTKTIK